MGKPGRLSTTKKSVDQLRTRITRVWDNAGLRIGRGDPIAMEHETWSTPQMKPNKGYFTTGAGPRVGHSVISKCLVSWRHKLMKKFLVSLKPNEIDFLVLIVGSSMVGMSLSIMLASQG
jgi:hypothetical protein